VDFLTREGPAAFVLDWVSGLPLVLRFVDGGVDTKVGLYATEVETVPVELDMTTLPGTVEFGSRNPGEEDYEVVSFMSHVDKPR
jgi:hypothetical protein